MLGRFRFTIGGLMAAVVVAAIDSALVAWAARSGPGDSAPKTLAFFVLPMLNLLGLDAFFLARRARGGRPPFGPVWSQATFFPQLFLVLDCLYLPFFWVFGDDQLQHGWPALGPILPGFFIFWPLSWLAGQVSGVGLPLAALATTLLIMGLVRLVARGASPWACGLALLVAIPSSLLAHAFSVF